MTGQKGGSLPARTGAKARLMSAVRIRKKYTLYDVRTYHAKNYGDVIGIESAVYAPVILELVKQCGQCFNEDVQTWGGVGWKVVVLCSMVQHACWPSGCVVSCWLGLLFCS